MTTMFANEFDVHDWEQKYGSQSDTPILGKLADNVAALVEWTNDNSDGWAYWPKPARAASKACELLTDADARQRDYRRDYEARDITQAQFVKAMAPIKAFLTRQGVPPTDVLIRF